MNRNVVKILIISIHFTMQPFEIDQIFGVNGMAIADFGMHSGTFNRLLGSHVKIQPDGKIVVVGDVYKDLNDMRNPGACAAVVRFNATGELDTTFGSNGKVVLPIAQFDSFGLDLDIQKDGKIVVAARAWDKLRGDASVVRLNSDGSFDTSFGDQGIIKEKNEGLNWSNFFRIKVREDGKVIAVGNKGVDINDEQFDYNTFFIAQYNADGLPDTSFGKDGKVTTVVKQRINSRPVDDAYSLDIQKDGKIIVAGRCEDAESADYEGIIVSEHTQGALVRYHVGGSLDTTFGHSGIVIHSLPSTYSYNYFNDVVVQPDGKIVAIGVAHNIQTQQEEFMVVRFTKDGLLDSSFGDGGVMLTALGDNASARNVMLSGNKILVTGVVRWGDHHKFTVVRYAQDGQVSSIFEHSLQNVNDRSYALALQKDGAVIVAGDSFNGSYFDIAVVRLKNNCE